MNKTCILVVTHKEFDTTLVNNKEEYKIIKVGSQLSDKKAEELGFVSDNQGKNIALLNDYYCELTALYWAWKNLPPEYTIIGLTHYRRYFFSYSKEDQTGILREKTIRDILKNKKIILPYPAPKSNLMIRPRKGLDLAEQDLTMGIVAKLLKEYDDSVLPYYEKLIYGNVMVWKNMFVTTRELFDNYCKWLFGFLSNYDQYIEENNIEKELRIDGFISEYLLPAYMYANLSNKEIKYMDILNSEELEVKSIKDKIKMSIRKNSLVLSAIKRIQTLVKR